MQSSPTGKSTADIGRVCCDRKTGYRRAISTEFFLAFLTDALTDSPEKLSTSINAEILHYLKDNGIISPAALFAVISLNSDDLHERLCEAKRIIAGLQAQIARDKECTLLSFPKRMITSLLFIPVDYGHTENLLRVEEARAASLEKNLTLITDFRAYIISARGQQKLLSMFSRTLYICHGQCEKNALQLRNESDTFGKVHAEQRKKQSYSNQHEHKKQKGEADVDDDSELLESMIAMPQGSMLQMAPHFNTVGRPSSALSVAEISSLVSDKRTVGFSLDDDRRGSKRSGNPSMEVFEPVNLLEEAKELIESIRNKHPEKLPQLLRSLLHRDNNPSPAMIAEVALIFQQQLHVFHEFPAIRDTKMIGYLGDDSRGLLASMKEYAKLAHDQCPLLLAVLHACQMSQRDMTEMKNHPGSFGDVISGGAIDHTQYRTGSGSGSSSGSRSGAGNVPKGPEAPAGSEFSKAEVLAAKGRALSFNTMRLFGELSNSNSSGQRASPYTLFISILMRIGGLSQSAYNVCSKLRMLVSKSPITTIMYEWLNRWKKDAFESIKTNVMNRALIYQVLFDNFNPHWWTDIMTGKRKYTHTIASLTMMLKGFKWPSFLKNHLVDTSLEGPIPDITDESIQMADAALKESSLGIAARMNMYKCPDSVSLRDYIQLPSLEGQSSKITTILSKIVAGVLWGLFNLKEQVVIVTADPEPGKIFAKLVMLLGGKRGPLRNAIIPIPVFHTVSHLTTELYQDVPCFAVLMAPFLKYMQYRITVFKNMQKNFVAKLNKARLQGAGGHQAAPSVTVQAVELETTDAAIEAGGGGDEHDLDTALLALDDRSMNGHVVDSDIDLNTMFLALVDCMRKKEEENQKKKEKVAYVDESVDERNEKERKKEAAKGAAQLERDRLDAILETTPAAPGVATKGGSKKKSSKDTEEVAKKKEYMKMKKLLHFLTALHECWTINRAEILDKCIDQNNPIHRYLMSIFDEQLKLAIGIYIEAVAEGTVATLYDKLPIIVNYFAYTGHIHLVKTYIFYLLLVLHWREKRMDILHFLNSISKWLNEVYIEHQHSRMARIIKEYFPGSLLFDNVRFSSMFSSFSTFIRQLGFKFTCTLSAPDSVAADVDDEYDDTDRIEQALRKHPMSSGKSPTLNVTEPLQQVMKCRNNFDFMTDVSLFIKQLFHDYRALDLASLIPADVDIMDRHRPLQQCMELGQYATSLFTNYRMDALKDEARVKEKFGLNTLRAFLEDQTLVGLINCLIARMKARVVLLSGTEGFIRFDEPYIAQQRLYGGSGLHVAAPQNRPQKIEALELALMHIATCKLAHHSTGSRIVPSGACDVAIDIAISIAEGIPALNEAPIQYKGLGKDYTIRELPMDQVWANAVGDIPAFLTDWEKKFVVTKRDKG